MTNEEQNESITLEGIGWLRVFSACQSLMMPTMIYGVTHKRCRQVLKTELGYCPKGKPGTDRAEGEHPLTGFRFGGEEAILAWLGINEVVHSRRDPNAIGSGDTTVIHFGGAA